MANAFDQFERPKQGGSNPFDEFDSAPPAVAKPAPATSSDDGDFVRGLKRTLPELKQLAGGTLAAVGDVTGWDGLRDKGLEIYRAGEDVVSGLTRPTDSATEAWNQVKQGNLGAGIDFLQNAAGYTTGQAIESLAAAGAGAVIGGTVGSAAPVAGTAAGGALGAVGGFVAKQGVKRLVKDQAEKLVAEQVAKGVAKKEAKKAGAEFVAERTAKDALADQVGKQFTREQLIKRGGQTVGAVAGAQGLNTMMELGSVYPEALAGAEEENRDLTGAEKARAVGASLGAAGLESVADLFNLGVLMRGTKGAAAEAAKEGLGAAVRRYAGRAAVAGTEGALREAGTEAAQTGLERFGAGQSLDDADAWRDYIDSAVVGAVGGGLFGGVAALHTRDPQAPGAPAPATKTGFGEDPADQLRADVLQAETDEERAAASQALFDHLQAQGRLLPPPTVTVDSAGEAGTAAQREQAAAALTGERDALGLTQDVNAARAAHPGAVPNLPFPDAAPGSMASAANTLAQAAAPVAPEAPAPEAAPAEVLNVPGNVDRSTGEVRAPKQWDRDTIKAYLAAQLERNHPGALPKASMLARVYGLKPQEAQALRREVIAEAKAAALSQEPTDALPARSAPAGNEDAARAGLGAGGAAVAPGAADDAGARAPVAAAESDDAGQPAPAAATGLSYDESEEHQDGDITPPSGSPFSDRRAADLAAQRHKGGRVFPVEGGFVVRTPRAAEASTVGRQQAHGATQAAAASEHQASDTPSPQAPSGAQTQGTAPEPRTSLEAGSSSTPARQAALAGLAESAVGTGSQPSVQATPEAAAVHVAAHEAATSPQNDLPEPTDAQKEAGNYKKGHARIAGLDISIENPAGSKRRPEWPALAHHYGYIKGSIGRDKDHVDVFLTEHAADTSRPVFIVDQRNEKGGFDEHKVVLGAATRAEAKAAYLANYSKGWKGAGAITQMTHEQFEEWVRDPDKTKRPASAPLRLGSPEARAAIDAGFAANRKAVTEKGLKKGDIVTWTEDGKTVTGTILHLGDKDQRVIAVGRPGRNGGTRDSHVPASQLSKVETATATATASDKVTAAPATEQPTTSARAAPNDSGAGAAIDTVVPDRADPLFEQKNTLRQLRNALAGPNGPNGNPWEVGRNPETRASYERSVANLEREIAEAQAPTKPDKARLIPTRRADGGVEVRIQTVGRDGLTDAERAAGKAPLIALSDPQMTRLEQVRNTLPSDSYAEVTASRRDIDLAIAQAREGESPQIVASILDRAAGRLLRHFPAQGGVLEEVADQVREADERTPASPETVQNPAQEASDVRRPGNREGDRAGGGRGDQRQQPAENRNDDPAAGVDAQQPAEAARAGAGGRAGVGAEAGVSDRAGGSERGAAEQLAPDADRVPAERGAPPDAVIPKTDLTITGELDFSGIGAVGKFKQNLAAITLLKQIEADGRRATPEEQSVLARYVGWGGLPEAFRHPKTGRIKKGWEGRVAELEAALTPEELAAAGRSTQDAHYTAANVVTAMWEAAQRLGFDRGRVLEPSMGTGNFFGLMPAASRAASSLTGIELDSITGRIAKQLYQTASVQVRGFNEIRIAPASFDLAIGNPPFGAQSIHDPQYPEESRQSIHNYFFAKSVASLRPGGVLAMVVSNSFLDANTSATRAWIAERARFLGAIRLPQTAFQQNANTAVTTDIVFLQRLAEGETGNPEAWVRVGSTSDKGNAFALNRYFLDHPDMMLGKMVWSSHTTIGAAGAVLEATPGVDLSAALSEAVAKLPENVYQAPGKTFAAASAKASPKPNGPEVPTSAKVYGYFVAPDGSLRQRQPDHNGEIQSVAVDLPEGSAARVVGMAKVRDLARALLRAELDEASSDAALEKQRKALNEAYDAFVKAHGRLSRDVNKRLFRDDPDGPLLLSLERDYDKGVSAAVAKKNGVAARKESAKKADIFTKRTNFPVKPVTQVSDAKSAMLASLNERGRLDPDFMAGIYPGKTIEDIEQELGDEVFRTPAGELVPADAYLSGNVKAKLAEAKASTDPRMRRNVAALEAVQPADIDPADIFVQLGTPWIPGSDYADFARETFEGQFRGNYVKALGHWSVDIRATNQLLSRERWGTNRMSAEAIMEALMGNKPIAVYDKVADDKRVLNVEDTAAAKGKAAELQQAFLDWIWKDAARRERLARFFNDTYNTDVRRRYNGAHMTFPGMNRSILTGGTLRPHQAAFAYRMVQDGVALADHVVGAGKTYASIAGIMEMRRLGLWRKPMVVVPNHLVDQWATDFVRLYPGANVLAASRKDFAKENRKRLFARIATGEWDAVVVAHSSFGFIPLPADAEASILQSEVREIATALDALRQNNGKKDLSFKQLQKRDEALKERIKRLSERRRDDLMDFAEMGVDALVVDEAHEFKNLYFVTTQRNVAGLGSPEGSKKAFDLFVKMRHLAERDGGKNRVFLTGTPVSNTLSEVFHMQRYLQYEELQARGVAMFDTWASTFGQIVSDWEMDAAGRFKEKARFRKFANLPELVTIWRQVADTITLADLKRDAAAQGRRFPIPKIKGGKRQNITVPRSPLQAAFIGEPRPMLDPNGNPVIDPETGIPRADYPPGSIIYRMDHMPTDPSIDNHLKATGDARKASLDYRLVEPTAPDFPGSKINVAVSNIARIWKENAARRGTQLVFCDLSVPASARGKATEAAQARAPTWFVRRHGDIEHVAGVKLTLSSMPDRKFFSLKTKRDGYQIYEAGSGVLITSGRTKQEAVDAANSELTKDAQDWLAQFAGQQIPGEEIDAYVQRWEDEKAAREEAAAEKGEEGGEEAPAQTISMDELLADESKHSVYDDMKAKLVAAGVPEREVAFIHDYDTDLQKADLFAKVNRGEIRILFGSTAKMGAGMNVQKKLVAEHHMDAPWRPSDLIQREGRILRQGNEFYEVDPDGFEVELYAYGTEQTYDARQWEIIETKAQGIETFQAGDSSVREIDDISSEAASAADMKGAASGNPLILESIKLRKEVRDLESQERSHKRATHAMETLVRSVDNKTAYAYKELRDAKARNERYGGEPFKLQLGSKAYTDPKEVKVEPVLSAFKAALDERGPINAGTFRGLDIVIEPHLSSLRVFLYDGREAVGATEFGREDKVNPAGFVTRLENIFKRIAAGVPDAEARVAKVEREADQAREELKRGFPKADELVAKRERQRKVVAALRAGRSTVEEDSSDTPRFRRAAPAQGGGMQRREAQAIVNRLRAAGSVTVVDTAADLPAAVIEETRRQAFDPSEIRAVHYRGRSYIVASAVSSAEEVQRAVFHEAFVHGGLRARYGADVVRRMVELANALQGTGRASERVMALARQQGIDLTAYVRSLNQDATKNDDQRLAILTEELLAHMGETTGTLRVYLQEVLGLIRALLRRLGFTSVAELGVSDLRAELRRAREAVRQASAEEGAAVPAFQRVFHGSRTQGLSGFSTDFIGQGAGDQLFGWGIYLASRKEVAEHYRLGTSAIRRFPGGTLADQALAQAQGDRAAAGRALLRERERAAPARRAEIDRAMDVLRRAPNRGQTYTVEIPEDSDLLAWDAALSQQPEKVRRALQADPDLAPLFDMEVLVQRGRGEMDVGQATGGTLYQHLEARLGAKGASMRLDALGIPGLRYLDGESRPAGPATGSYNYVIWQDASIADVTPVFSRRVPPATVIAGVDAVADGAPAPVVERAREAFQSLDPRNLRENLRPAWLGALTLRHLAELAKDIKLPQVGRYADRVQKMATDRNVMQEEAATTADRWERFQRKDRQGADATANLMHDATIAGVDPAIDYRPLMTGVTQRGGNEPVTRESIQRRLDLVALDLQDATSKTARARLEAEQQRWKDLLAREQARRAAAPALVQRWLALPEEGRAVYIEARDAYARQSDRLEQAIIDRINATAADGRTRQTFIAQVRQQFESARLEGPYFPLARFGDFWISAEKDGEPQFFMYERVQDWRQAQRDLVRQGFVVKAAGRKIGEARSVAGASTGFMADLEKTLETAGIDDRTRDEVWQLYLRSLPDLSMRKHFIHRKKTAGYSQDALRAFAGNLFHGSFQIARVRHTHALEADLLALKEATADLAKTDPERAAKAAAMTTEVSLRHEWVMNPKDSKAVSAVTSLGFAWYLGATPAAALVNLTQTAIVTFPVLASRFGATKAANALSVGMGRALRNVDGNLTRGLTDEEARAFQVWRDSGAIDRTMAHNLAGLSETDTRAFNPVARRAMNLVSLLFHRAEVVNREATALAAFRLARGEGMSFAEATKYAEEVITESHFDYSNANRARFMQSNAAKVLLLFRQYSLNMTWLLWRNAYLSWKGESKEVRSEARKKLAGVLGMTGVFAGAMGMPLMSVTFGLANAAAAAFGDDDDDPFDAETAFRNFLADMLGPGIARVLANGPVEALTGAEIGSRVSLNDLWLRDPDRELEGQAMADYLLEQAAGPVLGGMLVNSLRGMKQVEEGHTWRGVETMMPKAVKDGLKSVRYATQGVNTLRGDPVIDDLSVGQTLLQLAGFSPASLNERYDAINAAKNYEEAILDRRQRLLNAYAMAWRAQDAETLASLREKIARWNEVNPEVGITTETIRRSLAARMRYSSRAESGVVLDRRLAEKAREQARFGQ